MEDKTTEREGMLPIGTLLSNGKYRIERYLSSGGFGNTYEAIDTAFDERVAIKELYIKGVCGRETELNSISISLTENRRTFSAQQEKFKKEARRLRKLTNPHIVQVHDLFDENGTSYYVMDYVNGESLSQRMKRTDAPMTEEEVLRILPQMLDALETVHAEGIWHLDLKPGNIMIDQKGNALIIDFGASKQLRGQGNSIATSSAMAYTPGYAPSEQMEQNMEKFGPWTDLYALGATMYNLLTRRQPPSPTDIDEDVDAALPMPETVSQKTHDLILWLMEPSRMNRPQSVADVKRFLAEEHPVLPKREKKKKKKTAADDETLLKSKSRSVANKDEKPAPTKKQGENNKKMRNYLLIAAAVLVVGGLAALIPSQCDGKKSAALLSDSLGMDSIVVGTDKSVVFASEEGNRTFTVNGVSFTMIYVAGGTFVMGSTDEDAGEDESPIHNVTLNDYYIGETEVTQELWQAVMGENPSDFTRGEQLPVEHVNWKDCQTFISKLNNLTEQNFHLPTEAQWEYAARGGSKSQGYQYSGSNDIDAVAWHEGNSKNKSHSVKTKAPNELGIYDMSGNVWEWCSDWYGEYSSGDQTNPQGSSRGAHRVRRGGSWMNYLRLGRSSLRFYDSPAMRYNNLGLRLAL